MKYLSTFLIIILLCGCQTDKIRLNVKASRLLNFDNEGHSLPVVLKVYQLENRSAFYWRNTKDLISEEFFINPGQKKKINLNIDDEIRYIVFQPLFRHPRGEHQYYFYKIKKFAWGNKKVDIFLSHSRMQVRTSYAINS